MIPYKDDNPARTFPFITLLLIVSNMAVFFYMLTAVADVNAYKTLVYSYGAIPSYLISMKKVQPIHPSLTIFTSMFMHGGVLHLGSNMLYLWIFGNNVEDTLGHFRFLLFYILCGVAAAYGHTLTSPSSAAPMIGASGAISGVLGAYMIRFPRARIHTIIFLGFFIRVIQLPAFFVIGFWIVIQIINGMISKGVADQGGVAWFAHIGGFIAGIIIILMLSGSIKRRMFSY
ncbi:MAG: rhomboid family intramembrane serine protease [Nitrospirae bacterium]|nr:rhomboid family intramembrane serine protease [Nitrospirota bacterium]